MKNIVTIAIYGVFTSFLTVLAQQPLMAQLVTTIAGQAGVSGELDGLARDEALFNNPHGIAVDAQGNVYIADRFNHKIRLLTPDGEVVTLAGTGEVGSDDGPGSQATFHEPWGIAIGRDGVLYIADTQNNKVRKIDNQGNVSTLAGSGTYGINNGPGVSARFAFPTGISVDASGQIFVCDHLGHTIRKVSAGGYVTTLAGTPFMEGATDGFGSSATFYRPYGLEVDGLGNVYVADEWNHLIRKVTPAGLVSTLAGDGTLGSNDAVASEAQFNYPWDVTLDSLGNVYVMDGDNHVIRKIGVGGQVSTLVGEAGTKGAIDGWGSKASFNGATALCMAVDDQSIYVADAYNQLIRRVGLGERVSLSIPELAGGDSICLGDTLTFVAFPAGYSSYEFHVNGQMVGSTTEASWPYVASQSGEISLWFTAFTATGASITSPALTAFAAVSPSVDFSHTITSQTASGYEVDFVANLIDAVDWIWDFGDPASGDDNRSDLLAPSHHYHTAGTYSVTLTAQNAIGCSQQLLKPDLLTLASDTTAAPTSSPIDHGVFLPTAFTPNGDGLNDMLYLRAKEVATVDFCVINEWGQTLFRSTDITVGWDGTYNGKQAQSDTYVCIAHLSFLDGTEYRFTAQTTILR